MPSSKETSGISWGAAGHAAEIPSALAPMQDRLGAIVDKAISVSPLGNSVDVAMGGLIIGTGFDIAMVSAGLGPKTQEDVELTQSEAEIPVGAVDPGATGLDSTMTDCAAADHGSTAIDLAHLLHLHGTI